MRPEHDWLPYFAPMVGFALVLAGAEYVPGVPLIVWMTLRVVVPLGLFLYFANKGSFPELGGYRFDAAAGLDVLVGLGVAALWMAPYVGFEGLQPDSSHAFDPGEGGSRTAALTLRFIGFAMVTPIVEELLVRSFLMRSADVWETGKSFRDVPVGYYTLRGFLFTLIWFTFTHAQWEWPVAAATGALYNLWLYRRKHIGALITAHAATNAAIFVAVLWTAARGLDWWFFL